MKKTVTNILRVLTPPERSKMISLIIMDVIISFLDIIFLAALIYVIQFYTTAGSTQPFRFFSFSFFAERPLSLMIVFVLLFAVKNGLGYLVFKSQFRFVYAVASRLSKNNLLYFLQGNYTAQVDTDSSVQIRKISQHPVEFGHYVLAGFQQIAGQSILVVLTIIAIVIYSPLLFLLLFIILTPPLVLTGLFIKKKLSSIRKTLKPVSEKTLQHLQEALYGYVESNVFGKNDFFVSRYSIYQARFNDFLARQVVIQNLPSRFMEVFALFGLLVLIVLNYYSNDHSTLQLFTIGAFMAAAYKIIPGIVKILNSAGQIKTYEYTVAGLLQSQAEADELKNESNSALSSLSLQQVYFMHKQKSLLQNFSMEIRKGEMIGLTGISGQGKTTVINLLLGFLEPQSGTILMNDKISTASQRKSYWKNIAYVKQDPFLIYDTILTNISLSEGGYDKDRMEKIIKTTGLDLLVAQYPEGLNHPITEDGKNISGGQRQRIALARALYKNAGLLILDEPFNELDRASENNLLEHCKKLAEAGTMVILVTHNKESLSYCSKIISLDGN